MQTQSSNRRPLSWVAAFLLLAVGFVVGVTITSGDGGTDAVPRSIATATAIAAPSPATGNRGLNAAEVAELTMPSVVNISTDKVVENNLQHPFMNDPFFRRFFDVPEGQERVQNTLGSGVVISEDGYILTANHVVEKASKIRVSFQGNEEYEAEIVGADPQTDVALIKVDKKDLPYLELGNSDALRIGEEVMAIGNPFGVGQTVTKGIVSAKGRSIGLIDYEDLIQTDATINPGNSGGALVNMYGELVGMNTAILSRSGGSQGIGFAVPSNMADRILASLRDGGSVQRAWIGIRMGVVNQAMASYYDMDRPRGVLVDAVTEDSPAEDAGIQEGDIILAVDGTEVNTMSQLRNKVSLAGIGHEAEVDILRGGKEKHFEVKLAALPDQDELASEARQEEDSAEVIEGVTVRAINERIRQHAGLPDEIDGLIVAEVERLSNAATQGLARGDVILKVGGETVSDLEEFADQIAKNTDRPIFLRVYVARTGRETFMAIPR